MEDVSEVKISIFGGAFVVNITYSGLVPPVVGSAKAQHQKDKIPIPSGKESLQKRSLNNP